MVMNTVGQHYPNATEEGAYIGTTAATLATLGFTGENTLPVLAVCRDEICGSFVRAAEDQWGNSFTLGGLAGLPFGGKTGMGAASHHAPDIFDRERFIIYAMAHIGFGPEGEIGGCVRPGMEHLNGACGALKAYSGMLADGSVPEKIFADDAEFGLLTQRMAKVVPAGTSDLLSVTNAALTAIKEDIEALSSTVLNTKKVDYAVFTGTQIHLPNQHLVHASDSWVVLSGQRQEINFSAEG
jgi:hypothetical protein